jgi:ketosteroid isomerase-like protein
MRHALLTLLGVAFSVILTAGCTDPDQEGPVWRTPLSGGERELQRLEIMKRDRAADFDLQLGDPTARSTAFSPDGVVIEAGTGEIEGREAIQTRFEDDIFSRKAFGLTWAPQRAEVSITGDLGYSVGRYRVNSMDSSGAESSVMGSYVTIWRRQADSTWLAELSIRVPTDEPVAVGGAAGEAGTGEGESPDLSLSGSPSNEGGGGGDPGRR